MQSMEGLASFVSKSFDPSRAPQPHELPSIEDNSDDEGLDVGVETPPPSEIGLLAPRHPIFPMDSLNHSDQTDQLLSRQRALELAERLNTSDPRLSSPDLTDARLSIHGQTALDQQHLGATTAITPQGRVFIV